MGLAWISCDPVDRRSRAARDFRFGHRDRGMEPSSLSRIMGVLDSARLRLRAERLSESSAQEERRCRQACVLHQALGRQGRGSYIYRSDRPGPKNSI